MFFKFLCFKYVMPLLAEIFANFSDHFLVKMQSCAYFKLSRTRCQKHVTEVCKPKPPEYVVASIPESHEQYHFKCLC